MTSLDLADNVLKAEGAKHVAEAIKGHVSALRFDWCCFELTPTTKGALTSLNMSKNSLLNKESGKALADALKENSTLRELDVSNNYEVYVKSSQDGVGFAEELAIGVSASRALVKFDISKNGLYAAGGKALAEALNGNQVMTELNLAGNSLGLVTRNGAADMSGVIAVSDAIPTMGAMTSLNISKNNLSGWNGSSISPKFDLSGVKALAAALPECK